MYMNKSNSTARSLIAATFLAGLVFTAGAQTWNLGGAWSATNGVGHLANNNANRGLAYNAVSNQVFVATRAGATTGSIDVFDGTTGALLSGANGVNSANLGIDQIGVGDDGILYGMPLITSVSGSSLVTVYAWTNWNSTPYTAYQSSGTDPVGADFAGKRIGDTLAVRGSGTSTLILAAVAPSCTNFVLLHTTDGVNFTATAITNVPGLPQTGPPSGGNFCGLAFYTNNTFLVQPGSGATSRDVFLVSYPANFASQTEVSGTLLGNATALAGNPQEWLDYSPAGKMLAAAQAGASTQNAASIFTLTNFPASAPQLATTNFATALANGNATGGAALGGQGKTNFLYVLESNNGLQAYTINFATGAQPVVLGGPTGGVTNAFPPQTLTVTASGSPPIHYQWYVISGGTTNPVGLNTNFYTATVGGTNLYFVVATNAVNSATSAVVGLTLLSPVTNSVVSPLWSAGIGAYTFLVNDDATRGIAYSTNLNRVVVASHSGGTGLYILDGNTGSQLGTLSTAGLSSGGTFAVDQVGAADDGKVYVGNLALSGQTFALTQFPAPTNSAVGTQTFAGDPGSGSGDRWGDTMAVRGAGSGTQVLLGSKGTNVVLFTTADGSSFSPTLIAVTNVPSGFAGNGVAFGAGNTFWAKAYGGDLFEVAFDPVGMTGGAILDYHTSTGQIPAPMSGVGVDPVNNVYAGINLADRNNDLQLFQLTGTSDPPVLFDQAFFPSYNVNGNQNAAIAMKFPRAYALDVNNGLVAVTYGVPAETAPTITSPPASQASYTNNPSVVFTVGVSGSLPLYFQWRFNGTNILGATNRTYVLSYPPLSAAGSYDVIVRNIAGTKTSTPPAVLTLLVPTISPVVTQLWTLAAGSRPYLDSSSYGTRGLAYDTNTATVLVASHSAIYALSATNGSDLFSLNVLGVYSGGFAGWLFDQVGVANDGAVYGANLYAASLGASGFSITRWDSVSASANLNQAYGGTAGADPGNGSGDRWGDTMDVRGAGVNTEILLGSYNGTNVVLLTTTDGQNFTPNLIAVSNVPAGFGGQGIAFGAGDTFWAKSPTFNLRQVAFSRSTWTGNPVQSFTAGIQIPSLFDGIGVDVAANLLGGVNFSDTPNDLQLYILSGNTNPPALLDQAFFSSNNQNVQFNAATTLKGGKGFSLDVNNGITAVSYQVPLNVPLQPTQIRSVNFLSNSVTLTWTTVPGRLYQVQYRPAVNTGNWINMGPVLGSSSPTVSYTDTTATDAARFYRIKVQ
jgi:hypothetical protein